MAGRLKRGDVFLYDFRPPDKERPVVVLTRSISLESLTTVTVAPISSTIRGGPSQVRLDTCDGLKGPCVVNLHNLSTVPQTKLGRWVANLSEEKMDEICQALRYSLGCL